MTTVTTRDLRSAVERIPRVSLAHLPTPLERLDRFSAAIGGPRIWIKRDDCTGLAFGGNKARHNEFVLADAVAKKAEMLVWGGGLQSNNCRQTAASCAKLGIQCHLVLSGTAKDTLQGNPLLDHLLGASFEIVHARVGHAVDDLVEQRAEAFRQKGMRVYSWDRKVVKPLAAISYILVLTEIIEQLAGEDLRPTHVYGCSAGSTGSGLELAKARLDLELPIRHICPIRWPWDVPLDMSEIANDSAELLGWDTRIDPANIDTCEEFVGPDYGVVTAGGLEAIELLARSEGILLDPSYTGKAMAGLIEDIRQGKLDSDDVVVFVHTGGTPALFAYRDELVDGISAKSFS